MLKKQRLKKTIRYVMAMVTAVLVLSACVMYPPVEVSPQWSPAVKAMGGVVEPSLRDFMKFDSSPKVILRTPAEPGGIIADDAVKKIIADSVFAHIENTLLAAGFMVRDKALLKTEMADRNADYAAIRKKIDIDLVIEITALNYQSENQAATVFVDAEGVSYTGKSYNEISSPVASMDVRIIEVKTGKVSNLMLKVSAHELGDPGVTFLKNCPSHKRVGDSCIVTKTSVGYWFAGYQWSTDDNFVYGEKPEFYVGVPYERAAKHFIKQLLENLR